MKVFLAVGSSGSCRVDLVFVIDVSTSVEEEFQRQLQFAVDLVVKKPIVTKTSGKTSPS